MKKCPTCNEEFADKFSFCPVDGTPISQAASAAAASETLDTQVRETIPSPDAAYHAAAFESSAANDAGSSSAPDSRSQASSSSEPEYHLTIIEDRGIARRLATELGAVAHQSQLTWPEFKRDPLGFTKRSFTAYGQMAGGAVSRPNVALAMGAAVLSMVAVIVGVMWLESHQTAGVSRAAMAGFTLLALGLMVVIFAGWFKRDRSLVGNTPAAESSDNLSVAIATLAAFVFILTVVGGVIWFDRMHQRSLVAAADKRNEELDFRTMVDIPKEEEKVDKGTAGTNRGSGGGSKPKQDKPGGGGGGGREEAKPASVGKLPQASLTIPQVVAPDPNPPRIKNPSLPVVATIDADPLLFPTDTRRIAYGDPNSKSTETSSGSGSGNGIGTGIGGGVGSGEGGGVGPGRGGNTGGGDRHEGGGGAGGGGGGNTDYSRTFKSNEVSQKARITSKPVPPYTEEARKNVVSGTVVISAVLTAGGAVTNIKAVSSLPYGLTEKAIEAARQIKFTPAQKDGRTVSQYVRIEYSFTLY